MPAKKKKGKKKTKAELEAERLQKEEEERLAREAEEKRREEERLRREEEARKLKEKQHKYRTEELAWLKEEIEEYGNEIAARQALLESTEKREMEAYEWSTFLGCDPLPEPSSERELNTFLSLLADMDLQDLDKCELGAHEEDLLVRGLLLGERILTVLWRVLDDVATKVARGEDHLATRQMHFVKRLCLAHLDKLGSATIQILQHSNEYDTGDEKKGIMAQKEVGLTRFAVWVNDMRSGIQRFKPLDFMEVGMHIEIPKPIQQSRMAVRALFYPYDYISTDPEHANKELMTHRSLGGIFFLHLLEVPPPLKQTKVQGYEWDLRLSFETHLQHLEHKVYPLDGSSSIAIAPFRCHYRVPDNIVVPDDPVIAWWEPSGGGWNTEMASETELKEDIRDSKCQIIRFHALRIGTFALIQDRIVDFPYKSWSLEPIFDLHKYAQPQDWIEEATLMVETQRFKIEIQIKANKCRLLKPELPALEHLRTNEFKPGVLLKKLFDAGINLMPTDADANRIFSPDPNANTENLLTKEEEKGEENDAETKDDRPPTEQRRKALSLSSGIPLVTKHKALEAKLCQEISSLAASFDFKCSRWSQGRGNNQCVFQMRETSVFTGNNMETLDHMMCLMEMDEESESCRNAPGVGNVTPPGVKCSFIRTTETMNRFVTSTVNNDNTYIYLFNALKKYVTPEASARVNNSSVQFQQAVHQLLYLMRPFSFN